MTYCRTLGVSSSILVNTLTQQYNWAQLQGAACDCVHSKLSPVTACDCKIDASHRVIVAMPVTASAVERKPLRPLYCALPADYAAAMRESMSALPQCGSVCTRVQLHAHCDKACAHPGTRRGHASTPRRHQK
jgi:hypothetical protein